MKYNREEAISETLKWEGGYGNDPDDAGGATNYGITIADVRKYVKPNATAKDVKNLTVNQAIDIYRNKYWKTSYYDCDNLASGVDLSVFDFGVNSGPSRAKKYLLQAIGGTDVETIERLNDARLEFIRTANKIHPKFKKGLSNRVKGIKAKSLEIANRKPPKKEVGFLAAIIAAVYATWHWVVDHRILIGVSTITAVISAFLIYELIRKRKTMKLKDIFIKPWHKIEAWVAKVAPRWKTATIAFLGIVGNAAYQLQSYVTGLPSTAIFSAESMALTSLILFTLAFWFRGIGDRVAIRDVAKDAKTY